MKLVSMCLCGVNCNYKGQNKSHEKVEKMIRNGEAIPVCPEQLGGLPTPREPAEVEGGSGKKVLDGKRKVNTKDGEDVTEQFIKGAEEVLKIAEKLDIEEFIGKARSPSCGSRKTYNGSFSNTLVKGNGVTTALLKKNRIKVRSEEEL